MKKSTKKDAYHQLKEAREKYSEINLETRQSNISEIAVYAEYKGIEYRMCLYSYDMNLPCENFMKAVEHFLNKDDVFKKAIDKINNPPFDLSKRYSVEYILEMIILDNIGKKEMDRIYDKVIGSGKN